MIFLYVLYTTDFPLGYPVSLMIRTTLPDDPLTTSCMWADEHFCCVLRIWPESHSRRSHGTLNGRSGILHCVSVAYSHWSSRSSHGTVTNRTWSLGWTVVLTAMWVFVECELARGFQSCNRLVRGFVSASSERSRMLRAGYKQRVTVWRYRNMDDRRSVSKYKLIVSALWRHKHLANDRCLLYSSSFVMPFYQPC